MLVSLGPVTSWCHPIFSTKKLDDLFSHRPLKPFSCRLITTPTLSAFVFIQFSLPIRPQKNKSHSGVTPGWCHSGVWVGWEVRPSAPPPSVATDLWLFYIKTCLLVCDMSHLPHNFGHHDAFRFWEKWGTEQTVRRIKFEMRITTEKAAWNINQNVYLQYVMPVPLYEVNGPALLWLGYKYVPNI